MALGMVVAWVLIIMAAVLLILGAIKASNREIS